VRVIGGSNPHCIMIEASDLAAAEIEHRFGSVLLLPLECYASAQMLSLDRNRKAEVIEANQQIITT
jgi:predicted nuclease of predicted toxin-antitoxin system